MSFQPAEVSAGSSLSQISASTMSFPIPPAEGAQVSEGAAAPADNGGTGTKNAWLDWSLVKILPLSTDFGGTDKPAPVSAAEKNLVATTSNGIFPIGFHTLTTSTRGVTRGRGQWREKETLCLLHCKADKSGCPFKARYCRIVDGIEIWSHGEHDMRAHQIKPKRGLAPEARAFVTKNHHLSQRKLLEQLLEKGLVPQDSTADELKKIKGQIKRRKLTVKAQTKDDKLDVASMISERLEREREVERASEAAVNLMVAADNALAREEQEKLELEQLLEEGEMAASGGGKRKLPISEVVEAAELAASFASEVAAAAALEVKALPAPRRQFPTGTSYEGATNGTAV